MNIGKTKDKLDVTENSGELVAEIVPCLGNYIEFVVTEEQDAGRSCEDSPAAQAVNPFHLMMASQRSSRHLPPLYEEHTKKTALKNDILKWLEKNELGWSPDECKSQGEAFLVALGDTLWELNGHAKTLEDRGCPIPTMFEHFQGYNKPEKSKHRKRSLENLQYHKTQQLSQKLFQLCGSSYLKRKAWKAVCESLLRLADSLRKYASYLEKKATASQGVHASKVQRTDVNEWKVYSLHTNITPTKKARYNILHEALLHAQPYDPVFVNEYAPSDRKRRNEFVDEFVAPCKVVQYSYTGSKSHLHFMWKANLDDSGTGLLQKNDRIKGTLKT